VGRKVLILERTFGGGDLETQPLFYFMENLMSDSDGQYQGKREGWPALKGLPSAGEEAPGRGAAGKVLREEKDAPLPLACPLNATRTQSEYFSCVFPRQCWPAPDLTRGPSSYLSPPPPLDTSTLRPLAQVAASQSEKWIGHKRQKPQAPTPQASILNRQTRRVAIDKLRKRYANLT